MKEGLKKYDSVAVDVYERYVQRLQTEKDRKTGNLKNPWSTKRNLHDWIYYFQKVANSGIYIDGENVTLSNIGISLNYQAYKNLVLLKYPEAIFDAQLVKEGDKFTFTKDCGKVNYTHKMLNPFSDKAVVGGYCIIKIRTGEFIEVMSLKNLEQIRGTAKTDYIWRTWTEEMYLKSLLKRACKRHFRDITEALDVEDNKQYDPSMASLIVDRVKACKTIEDLEGVQAEFQDTIQELSLDHVADCKAITSAMGKKGDELYIDSLEDKLDNCDEYDDLDFVFANHEHRINTLKAADKKHVTEYLASRKDLMMAANKKKSL